MDEFGGNAPSAPIFADGDGTKAQRPEGRRHFRKDDISADIAFMFCNQGYLCITLLMQTLDQYRLFLSGE
jgi:hypothetical protein